MIGIIFAIIVLAIFEGLLVALFYYLNKRVDSLTNKFNEYVVANTDALKLVYDNCQTLRQNDDILSKDIEVLMNELQGIQKKIKRHS